MVRVLQTGKIKVEVYVFTCTHCDSKLEADPVEVNISYGEQRDPYTYYSIVCPVCNKKTGTYKDPKVIKFIPPNPTIVDVTNKKWTL